MAPLSRTTGRKALWLAGVAALSLAALELAYLVVGNVVLSTRLVRNALSAHPDKVVVEYERAYTVLPGRVHLSGFSMRLQDRHIQFELKIARTRVDVHPFALLRKTFHGDHIRCEGVSFRFVHKVRDVEGIEPRLAAYPAIPGFARPPLLQVPPPPPPTQAEIDAMWTVRLDDVRATVRELWFLEYRWEGTGHVAGGFELSPLRRARIGPAELVLDGGELHAGRHLVAADTTLHLGADVQQFDVQAFKGARVFRPISATLRLELKRFSPALLALYVPGLTARGEGALAADFRVDRGRLEEGSRLILDLDGAHAKLGGFAYQGSPRLRGSFDPAERGGRVARRGRPTGTVHAPGEGDDAQASPPRVHARFPGSVLVEVPHRGDVRVDLGGLTADLTLSGHDLAEGISLGKLSSRVGEARIEDARAISAAIGSAAPVPFLGALLGQGPLVASGGIDETEDVTIARLRDARLGAAELHGAARRSHGRWDGAAAGHLGILPIGIRLKAGKPEVALFVPDGWLDGELAAAGIRFEEPLAR